jgi:hypothetical protein
MTRADATKQLKALGVRLTYDRGVEEYRVNIKPDNEATAYYTPDLQDAIGTGKAMAAHLAKSSQAKPGQVKPAQVKKRKAKKRATNPGRPAKKRKAKKRATNPGRPAKKRADMLRPAAGRPSPRVGKALKAYARGGTAKARDYAEFHQRRKLLESWHKNKQAGRRRNADDDSLSEVQAQYEAFHGRASSKTTDKDSKFFVRQDFAEIGKLLDLYVWLDEDSPVLLKPRGVHVVTSGDGGSLYFQGGDQEIPIEALGLARFLPKDYIKIGDVQTIAYHSTKGFHHFEPTDYTHDFGEEGGELPALNYDTINKLFFLTGGSYQVRPEGITN